MRRDSLTNFLLLLIAVALMMIALRPWLQPQPTQAQGSSAYPFYIEPGVQVLHNPDGTGQVYGKLVVDLRNGKIWGFPTTTLDPYPTSITDNKPPVSHPFFMGTYAFADVSK